MLNAFLLVKNKGKYQSKNKLDSLNKCLLEYNSIACVVRFMVSLSYDTEEILFKGVGSPLDDVPLNIKPYLNKLKKDWFEKLPYRPIECKTWKPIVLRK